MTALQQILGTELPIIQAPMAGVQGSALAIAVCGAGALGSLPAAMLAPDALRTELAAIEAAVPGRAYNVNFFCHVPPLPDPEREARWRAEMADVLAAFSPRVVSFHFGLPAPALLAPLKARGCCILSSATTVDEALWLEAHGADVVIAQGLEAGGHRGMFLGDDLATQTGTFALLPQVVRAVRVPVVAAGGIADAAGVAAALALGAAGVQVGTAYLLCHEAKTSAPHRAALAATPADRTVLTNVFTGRPARGIVNRLVADLGPISAHAPAFPLAGAAVAPLRAAAEARGSGDFSPLWSGQNASGCRPVPAAVLTRELAAGLGGR